MTDASVLVGNAAADVAPYRGWLVGHFVRGEDGQLRQSKDVEIAWRVHRAGEARHEWVTGETRTTIVVMVSGRHRISFAGASTDEVILSKPGDYVMWGPGVDHRWYAETDVVFVCVRWPSLAPTS